MHGIWVTIAHFLCPKSSRLAQYPPYMKPSTTTSFCTICHSVSRPEPRRLYHMWKILVEHQDIAVMPSLSGRSWEYTSCASGHRCDASAARQIKRLSASSWLLSSKCKFLLFLMWHDADVMTEVSLFCNQGLFWQSSLSGLRWFFSCDTNRVSGMCLMVVL